LNSTPSANSSGLSPPCPPPPGPPSTPSTLIGALSSTNVGDGFAFKERVAEIPGTDVGPYVNIRQAGENRTDADLRFGLDLSPFDPTERESSAPEEWRVDSLVEPTARALERPYLRRTAGSFANW